MSWQAASYGILAIVLVGGFAWYERSRPPAQTVALVAAMAALAVAGRLAFTVLPNVVATTDIVFFTGYAIGPAPGFVVGALAGLVSNFWLGQGPWTPWQMAGWGMCGLGGAALAYVCGRRLNRYALAAACGAAGLLYGALLDFSLMVTYGGEQSLDRFIALSARGIPFNVAHATGNVLIALVAGPALVRMLIRFRERFEVTWSPQPAVLLIAAGVSLALALPADRSVAAAGSTGTPGATSWLRAAQNADGGYATDVGGESSAAMTGWVALAFEGAGINPLDVAKGGQTPISYLRAHAKEVQTLGDLERTILVLRGAGLGARGFGGRNLVEDLRRARADDRFFSNQVNLVAFGVLALESAGSKSGNAASAAWLADAQNGDGGWGFALHTASDADSTGAAMQALAAAGGHEDSLEQAVGFLRSNQRPGGGFPLLNGSVNAQSTAWAVQGLAAADKNPASLKRSGDPLRYLAGLQQRDGSFRYSAGSEQTPVWVTGQVVLARERQAFPIAAVPAGKTRPPAATENVPAAPSADGGGGGVPVAKDPKREPKGPAAPQGAPAAAIPLADPGGAPVTAVQAEDDDDQGWQTPVLVAGGLTAALLLGLGGYWLLRRRR